MFLSVSVAITLSLSRRALAAAHCLGLRFVSDSFFLVAKAAPSVVAFEIFQALLNVRVAIGGVSLLANVELWDVPNPWLLFGRIVVVVGDAADVLAKPFQGFVDVVGGPWSRRAKFEPHS